VDLYDLRVVRLSLWSPHFVKLNYIEAYRRPPPQVVHIYPVRVFRRELGSRSRILRCTGVFLWSGGAASLHPLQ
jgi:hypothetical protein